MTVVAVIMTAGPSFVALPGTREDALRRDTQERCREPSARSGAAHWYGASCGDEWTAWCLAEAGSIVRYYDVFDPGGQIGPPHPAESGYLLPHEDGFPPGAFDGVDPSGTQAFTARYRQVKEELAIPDAAHATAIAARASVNPAALGPSARGPRRAADSVIRYARRSPAGVCGRWETSPVS